MNIDPNPRIAQAIQQDLAAVGIKAEHQEPLGPGRRDRRRRRRGRRADDLVGRHGLDRRLPRSRPTSTPAILGCGGAVEGGWNWSWYCNRDSTSAPPRPTPWSSASKQAERAEAWKGIFDDVMEDAPWVPIFNEKRFTMHSDRLGGDAIALHRSDPHPGELRLHLRQGRPVAAASNGRGRGRTNGRAPFAGTSSSGDDDGRALQPHHPQASPRLEQRQSRRCCPIAPGRDASSSRPSIPRAGSSRRSPPSPISPSSISPRSIRSPGPIYVDGAEPGDAIKVTLLDFTPSRLGLDREHPGLRPARRPVQGAGAAYLDLRHPAHGAGRLWAGRPRAAEALLRHHRPGAGRAGTAQHRPAAPGRRQHGHPRHGRRHRALSAGRGGGRPVLGRRHPCRPGRRRGLRHGDRKPDERRARSSSW